MNTQGPDKIDWTDATINPVVGCTHGCDYCYARRQAKRRKHSCSLCYDFIPHPHLERLDKLNSRQKPKKIFIDSMWDWNCKDNRLYWMNTILEKIRECKQHTFQILSKFPQGYKNYDFPENVWIGGTIDTQARSNSILNALKEANASVKFISFEPLLENLDVDLQGINWIIIGADSRVGADKPPMEWADNLIIQAKKLNIPVFVKENYKYKDRLKAFPEKLKFVQRGNGIDR
jgi:protein gp37